MAFARGKYAKAISDRSGMEFPYNEMVREWNGSFVHKSEFEARHPQDQPRAYGAEGHGLRNARPARTEKTVVAILGPNPFETIAASSGIINVFEKSHGRSTDDTVRFRGPIWTSSDSDAYQNPVGFDGLQERIWQKPLATRLPLVREIQAARLPIPMTTTTLL